MSLLAITFIGTLMAFAITLRVAAPPVRAEARVKAAANQRR
ncbi:MAG: hypothetical protein ACK4YU_04685 [Paracoccus sp. (in: a-proteobacteria)]